MRAAVCGWWFGEDQGRYLLAARDGDAAAILAAAGAAGVLARAVGRTGGDALILGAGSPHIDRSSCARRTRAGCPATWRPTRRPDGSDLPMPMSAAEIERVIRESLPDARSPDRRPRR